MSYYYNVAPILTPQQGSILNRSLRQAFLVAEHAGGEGWPREGEGCRPPPARAHIVLRSVLRNAVNAGMLEDMPRLGMLPKSGRKAVNPMRRAELDAILAAASPPLRMAIELAAFAGLLDANDLRSAIERIDGSAADHGHPKPAQDQRQKNPAVTVLYEKPRPAFLAGFLKPRSYVRIVSGAPLTAL